MAVRSAPPRAVQVGTVLVRPSASRLYTDIIGSNAGDVFKWSSMEKYILLGKNKYVYGYAGNDVFDVTPEVEGRYVTSLGVINLYAGDGDDIIWGGNRSQRPITMNFYGGAGYDVAGFPDLMTDSRWQVGKGANFVSLKNAYYGITANIYSDVEEIADNLGNRWSYSTLYSTLDF